VQCLWSFLARRCLRVSIQHWWSIRRM
jgi:hypothetical protein